MTEELPGGSANVVNQAMEIVEQISPRPMTFRDLQKENAIWVARNFPNKAPYHPLLGVVEELGELAHAFLKAEQGIRVGEDHQAAKIDAVGDLVVFLSDFCTKNEIDFQEAVERTWAFVRKRDWIRFPKNGLTE